MTGIRKITANNILLLYILWIAVYSICGQLDSWALAYYSIESIMMAAMPLLLLYDAKAIKAWIAWQVSGYLIFRVVFMNLLFIFPEIAWMNENVWIMRGIGLIMLILLIINRRK